MLTVACSLVSPFCIFAADYTITAPGGGDAHLIGTWNPLTKTCTLTNDVQGSIEIASDGVHLNGNGHTVSPSPTSSPFAGVTIKNRKLVVVKKLTVAGWFGPAIVLESSTLCVVKHCTVFNNFGDAIAATDVSFSTVKANTLSGSRSGLNAVNCTGNLVKGNTITGHRTDGLVIDGGAGNVVRENTVSGNKFSAVLILNSSANWLQANTLGPNLKLGILLNASSRNLLTQNTLTGNLFDAILLTGSKKNVLSGNTATGNGSGITLFDSGKNMLFENAVRDSTGGHGFQLDDGSALNLLKDNLAVNNIGFGYLDDSLGPHTAGTANIYLDNECSGNLFGESLPEDLCEP